MSKRIIIISGGELNEEFVLSILEKEENQYVIGVDRGMEFLCRHQILPNYITTPAPKKQEESAKKCLSAAHRPPPGEHPFLL